MRWRLSLWAVVLCAVVWPLVAQAENYAFLVAVQDYDVKDLKSLNFTRNDILEFAELLKKGGYQDRNIVVMTDKVTDRRFLAEAEKIRKQLDLLLTSVDAGDSLIVAFSGHGIQFEGDDKNYFCPVDAELEDSKHARLIAINEIYERLKTCPAEKKLLLVDACRNDPLSAIKKARQSVRLKSVTRPQTEPVPKGIVALFSCAEGQESYEWPELKHGIFFHHVLTGWKGAASKAGDQLTLDDLVAYAKVETQSFARTKLNSAQTPQLKSEFDGSWILWQRSGKVEAQAAYERALKNAREKRHNQTLAELNRAIELDPKFAAAYAERALLHTTLQQDELALADADRAIELDPKNFLAYHSRATVLLYKNQLQAAFNDCNKSLELEPKSARAFNQRGLIYAAARDTEHAVAEFGKAIQQDAKNSEYLINRGKLYGARGIQAKSPFDLQFALADFTKAIELDPKNAAIYEIRAYVNMNRVDREKTYDAVIADLTKAIEIDRNRAANYNYRAYTYAQKKLYAKAIADYSKFIELRPNDLEAYLQRSTCYRDAGEMKRAIADATHVVSQSPKSPEAHGYRGTLYLKDKNYDEAILEFSVTLDYHRVNPAVLEERAKAYQAKGQTSLATRDLDKALAIRKMTLPPAGARTRTNLPTLATSAETRAVRSENAADSDVQATLHKAVERSAASTGKLRTVIWLGGPLTKTNLAEIESLSSAKEIRITGFCTSFDDALTRKITAIAGKKMTVHEDGRKFLDSKDVDVVVFAGMLQPETVLGFPPLPTRASPQEALSVYTIWAMQEGKDVLVLSNNQDWQWFSGAIANYSVIDKTPLAASTAYGRVCWQLVKEKGIDVASFLKEINTGAEAGAKRD